MLILSTNFCPQPETLPGELQSSTKILEFGSKNINIGNSDETIGVVPMPIVDVESFVNFPVSSVINIGGHSFSSSILHVDEQPSPEIKFPSSIHGFSVEVKKKLDELL